MLSAFRAFFHRQPPASPARPAQPARQLAAEHTSEFFAWFHLEADGTPVPDGDDLSHRFRPAGSAFQSVVALDVVTDAADGMRSACLSLDRSFVSGPEDAFARDIAKSFLGWILDSTAQERAQPLIAHIADLSTADAPVIAAEPLPPPADPTGAYAVFTGDADAATLDLGSAMLALINAGGRLSIEAVLLP